MSKIIQALAQLDATNDAHWTSDGLPRIETVRFMAGDQTITREDINAAAPGYSRANRTAPADLPAQGADQAVVSTTATDAGSIVAPAADTLASLPDTGGTNGEVYTEATEGAAESESASERATLETELAAAQAELAEIEQAFIRAEAVRSQARAKVDRCILAIDKLPQEPTSAPFQGYLAHQARELEQRAARRKQLAEGNIDLNALQAITNGSPLDRAMARKGGFGTRRPGAKV